MTAYNLGKAAMTAVAMTILAIQAMAQSAPTSQPQAVPVPAAKRTIVVSLEDRKLALVEDGQVKKLYTVAVGKPTTPSPEGEFTIERRAKNPVYHHAGKTVQPGPSNPVGTRWMGLSKAGYGIHGTNEPKSIGKAASHGCIRMAKADLEEFYELVAAGDTVRIVGERNEETVKLFGEPVKPTAPAPVLAQATPIAASVPLAPAAQAIEANAAVYAVTALLGSR
jgi:lipoprotein-anchoring transpeptidase ErfK/SrfK